MWGFKEYRPPKLNELFLDTDWNLLAKYIDKSEGTVSYWIATPVSEPAPELDKPKFTIEQILKWLYDMALLDDEIEYGLTNPKDGIAAMFKEESK